jgi:DNA-binding transcriptional MerR regulator
MYTIGQLAKSFGLSRSTLLYYDRAGLLNPRGRKRGDYRYYDEKDAARLERIRCYREAGLSVATIRGILNGNARGGLRTILESRLCELNDEIRALREQQHLLATLLGRHSLGTRERITDRRTWVALLRSAGYDEAAMNEWHARFEYSDPRKHEQFLRRLGIPTEEIRTIRAAAKRAAPESPSIKR